MFLFSGKFAFTYSSSQIHQIYLVGNYNLLSFEKQVLKCSTELQVFKIL